jgi:two-component system, chemotaxis family, chemotaxis protein CheY
MTTLIIDDSRAMRQIIARTLKEIGLAGTSFLEACDAAEGLSLIRQAKPDLVMSDFNMPGMSGLELLRELAAQGPFPRFGFVTSEASAELQDEARQAGASFVITKPFTAAKMGETLGPILADLGVQSVAAYDGDSVQASEKRSSFPRPPQIAAVLRALLRRAVTAAPVGPVPLQATPRSWVVEYTRTDDNSVIAYAVCDLALAARVGAALSLIPAGPANEAIASGQLADTLFENFREVLNVLTQLFESSGRFRVCLHRIHKPGEALPPQLADHLSKPKSRTDVAVDVSGYGKGALTLLCPA